MVGEALLDVGAMLAAIAVVGVAAERVGLSPIPFYILAGIGVNEFVAGRLGLPVIEETAFVTVGAEVGIVLLLLFLGMEFSVDRLLADRSRILRAGAVDFAVNFGAGLALGYLLFGTPATAILVAGIVYVSSSAVITKTLLDVGWIANPESDPMLGTLVFEDLVVAIYLAVLTGLVLGGDSIGAATRSIAIALGVMAVLVLLVVWGTRVLERVLDTPSIEFFVLRALGVAVFVAGAALTYGVSEAVAAFFVGMALGSTGHVHDLEESLVPLRDTFAAIFFFWIGLVTDPLAVLDVLPPLVLVVVATVPTKLLSGYYGGRVYGLSDRRSLRVGLGMVTRGEFSLIIGAAALAAADVLGGGVGESIYALSVGYVLVMSVLGTVFMQFSGTFEALLERVDG